MPFNKGLPQHVILRVWAQFLLSVSTARFKYEQPNSICCYASKQPAELGNMHIYPKGTAQSVHGFVYC